MKCVKLMKIPNKILPAGTCLEMQVLHPVQSQDQNLHLWQKYQIYLVWIIHLMEPILLNKIKDTIFCSVFNLKNIKKEIYLEFELYRASMDNLIQKVH